MKLTIMDRLVIQGLYPSEGNIITQVLVKDIQDKIEFTQEEIKESDLKSVSGGYKWNKDKVIEKEIKFTEAEIELLKAQIDVLDKGKKITQHNLELCLKIRNYKENKRK